MSWGNVVGKYLPNFRKIFCLYFSISEIRVIGYFKTLIPTYQRNLRFNSEGLCHIRRGEKILFQNQIFSEGNIYFIHSPFKSRLNN